MEEGGLGVGDLGLDWGVGLYELRGFLEGLLVRRIDLS